MQIIVIKSVYRQFITLKTHTWGEER